MCARLLLGPPPGSPQGAHRPFCSILHRFLLFCYNFTGGGSASCTPGTSRRGGPSPRGEGPRPGILRPGPGPGPSRTTRLCECPVLRHGLHELLATPRIPASARRSPSRAPGAAVRAGAVLPRRRDARRQQHVHALAGRRDRLAVLERLVHEVDGVAVRLASVAALSGRPARRPRRRAPSRQVSSVLSTSNSLPSLAFTIGSGETSSGTAPASVSAAFMPLSCCASTPFAARIGDLPRLDGVLDRVRHAQRRGRLDRCSCAACRARW